MLLPYSPPKTLLLRLSSLSSWLLLNCTLLPLSDKNTEAIIDATAKSAKARGLVTSFALVEAENAVKITEEFGIKRFPSSLLVVCLHVHIHSAETCQYNS